ncbi:GAF domain-containing protein [Candidatus Dojkabacteria bacterium]|uniref:GAF domain-containing protein n=1 Tax=Candidatus Dojkabacteria bacterium TaxID=2099670 RepID=A0A955LAX1_9BACT|nr:GAF domain-containing protein [Candidatus Dojkabacteria bacterium]
MKIDEIENFIKKNKISGFIVTVFFAIVTGLVGLIINLTPEIPSASLIVATSFILIVAPFYSRITFYSMIIVFTAISVFFLNKTDIDFVPALIRLFTFDIFLLVVGEGFINVSESRDLSQKALSEKTSLLEVIIYFVQKAFDNNYFDELPYVMQRIGQISDVSRVYLFSVGQDTRGYFMSQRYEWTNGTTTVQIDNPELQKLYFKDAGFERWLDIFLDEKTLKGNITTFPESEKPLLVNQEILSLLAVPIFSGTKIWGFIGFDECRYEREWDNNLIEILKLFANLLGASINSKENSDQIIEHAKDLENSNKLMINRELKILELKERIKELENKYATVQEKNN